MHTSTDYIIYYHGLHYYSVTSSYTLTYIRYTLLYRKVYHRACLSLFLCVTETAERVWWRLPAVRKTSQSVFVCERDGRKVWWRPPEWERHLSLFLCVRETAEGCDGDHLRWERKTEPENCRRKCCRFQQFILFLTSLLDGRLHSFLVCHYYCCGPN